MHGNTLSADVRYIFQHLTISYPEREVKNFTPSYTCSCTTSSSLLHKSLPLTEDLFDTIFLPKLYLLNKFYFIYENMKVFYKWKKRKIGHLQWKFMPVNGNDLGYSLAE